MLLLVIIFNRSFRNSLNELLTGAPVFVDQTWCSMTNPNNDNCLTFMKLPGTGFISIYYEQSLFQL